MAASDTEIANMALGHLGYGKQIGSLDTERSDEANICRVFYPSARDEALRDFAWPFATKFLNLGLVLAQPNTEWGFSYRYPSDCLNFRRILSGMRNDSRQSRVPYKLASDDQGGLIFSDMQFAIGEYTAQVTNVLLFPPDFAQAVALLLASYIAPKVTAGDPYKMGARALQLYQAKIGKAQANALNEEEADEDVDSEFIRGRDL